MASPASGHWGTSSAQAGSVLRWSAVACGGLWWPVVTYSGPLPEPIVSRARTIPLHVLACPCLSWPLLVCPCFSGHGPCDGPATAVDAAQLGRFSLSKPAIVLLRPLQLGFGPLPLPAGSIPFHHPPSPSPLPRILGFNCHIYPRVLLC